MTCLVRRPSLGARLALAGDRLRECVVDFDALSAADVEPLEADDVFCALGTTMKKAGSREAFRRVDYTIPLRAIELAVKAGATRLALVSSVGADASSSSFYLRTKGELEDALALLPLRMFHVFRPSLLQGERGESRPGEAIGGAFFAVAGGILLGGLRKYRPIDGDAVARAMVAAMLRPDTAPAKQIHFYDQIVELAR